MGLERMGGFLLYDISRPSAPVFGGYVYNRAFDPALGSNTAALGDLAPEGVRGAVTRGSVWKIGYKLGSLWHRVLVGVGARDGSYTRCGRLVSASRCVPYARMAPECLRGTHAVRRNARGTGHGGVRAPRCAASAGAAWCAAVCYRYAPWAGAGQCTAPP